MAGATLVCSFSVELWNVVWNMSGGSADYSRYFPSRGPRAAIREERCCKSPSEVAGTQTCKERLVVAGTLLGLVGLTFPYGEHS